MVRCNTCGGALVYDIPSKKIKCLSCSNLYEVTDFMDASDGETVDMNVFTCPQCGGEIYSNDQTAQGFCSFCGASTTLTQRLVSWKKPEKILPFEIPADQARKIFADSMKSRFFAPKELKDENYIESYRGIYMPFWVYDTSTSGQVHAEFSRTRGNDTYFYDVSGNFTYDADGYSHDASTTFADDIGDAVVPYDLSKAKDFHSVYMSGFYGDAANAPAEAYQEEICEKINEDTDGLVAQMARERDLTPGFSKLMGGHLTQNNTRVTRAHNYMLPVWFLSYQKKGRVAYAAINGQTGEMISDTPVDTKKYIGVSLLIALALFALTNLLFTFTPGKGVLAIGLATFAIAYMTGRSAKMLADKETSDAQRLSMKEKGEKPGWKGGLTALLILCGVLFTAIGGLDVMGILINRNDMVYYGMMVVNGAIDLIALIKCIFSLNRISMRKLPQFDYKGGNTNA